MRLEKNKPFHISQKQTFFHKRRNQITTAFGHILYLKVNSINFSIECARTAFIIYCTIQ